MRTVKFEDKEVKVPRRYKHLRKNLRRFARHHRRYKANVFLMMPFKKTAHNRAIAKAINKALKKNRLVGLRADQHDYARQLWDNVCTYMLGCRYSIAVFEKSCVNGFNANVAIELGFLLANNKKVLILKDKKVPELPADLRGFLYREYDSIKSIREQVRDWMPKRKR